MVQLPTGATPWFVTRAWWDRKQSKGTAGCRILFPSGNRDTLPRNILIVWYPQAFPKFSLISHYFSWVSKMLSSLKLLEFSLEVYSRHRACLSDPLPNHIISHLHGDSENLWVVWLCCLGLSGFNSFLWHNLPFLWMLRKSLTSTTAAMSWEKQNVYG